METEKKSPAINADSEAPASNAEEPETWGQSVKDSKWATAEPTAFELKRNQQPTNSSGSQWATAETSYNPYGRERRYNDYGSNDRYRRDNSLHYQPSDNRRHQSKHFDNRSFDRSHRDDNDNNRSYGNVNHHNLDNRLQNRSHNYNWRSDNNLGHDQGYRGSGRNFTSGNRSRFDNDAYSPRSYDVNSHFRNDRSYGRQNQGWNAPTGSEFRRQFDRNDNYSHASWQDNSGSQENVHEVKQSTDLEDRPWNKRFLTNVVDGPEASIKIHDNGKAEEPTTPTSSHNVMPLAEAIQLNEAESLHHDALNSQYQLKEQPHRCDGVIAEAAIQSTQADHDRQAVKDNAVDYVYNGESIADITESAAQVETHNNSQSQDRNEGLGSDQITDNVSRAYQLAQERITTDQDIPDGDKNNIKHSLQHEESTIQERRPSIEIGNWGRPPCEGDDAASLEDQIRTDVAGLGNSSNGANLQHNRVDIVSPSGVDDDYENKSENANPIISTGNSTEMMQNSAESIHATTQQMPSIQERRGSQGSKSIPSKMEERETRLATGGFMRKNLDEDVLNARIERIRLQNEKLELKRKMVEEEEREMARQMQQLKEEREKHIMESEKIKEELRLAEEQKKREALERDKRITDEIRAEREANAARKAQAMAGRDRDLVKDDDEAKNINDGRSWSDFVDDKFRNNRSRLERHRLEHQQAIGHRNHSGGAPDSFMNRQFNANEKKQEPAEKAFSLTDEKWPDLGGSSVGAVPAKAGIWPARAALEAKALSQKETPKALPDSNSPLAKFVTLNEKKAESLVPTTEIPRAEKKISDPPPKLKWEDLIAKQKPVKDWAMDSPTGDELDFGESPFG